jgi:hypothetical protein
MVGLWVHETGPSLEEKIYDPEDRLELGEAFPFIMSSTKI